MTYEDEVGCRSTNLTFPRIVNVHHGVVSAYFTDPNWLLLVAGVLYKNNEIALIEPARAPKGACTRIFPQEKVKSVTDNSLHTALIRGLQEELGFGRKNIKQVDEKQIYQFSNPIPPVRNCGRAITKHIVYFSVEIKDKNLVALNPHEVRRIDWVSSFEEFMEVQDLKAADITSHRMCKCAAQLEVILEMKRRHHIKWDDFPEELLVSETASLDAA